MNAPDRFAVNRNAGSQMVKHHFSVRADSNGGEAIPKGPDQFDSPFATTLKHSDLIWVPAGIRTPNSSFKFLI